MCKRYERSTNKEQERESVDYYVMLLVLDGECHGVSNLVQDFAQVLRSMGGNVVVKYKATYKYIALVLVYNISMSIESNNNKTVTEM